ncbi:2-phospho-L-lactate transferase [Microbacterium forte]|uniref:2-phospho-L-lactate transferase n=1 Tax=Microbacterium forte TaxID=2982533 RepID=UPI00289382CB|nr:2-phospho-L-lactate transferase [Microbacterium sp. A(2022)]
MRAAPRVVVLAGGVGGGRFVLGMREALRRRDAAVNTEQLTVVVNTGDDLWLSGVRLQPDVDSVMYALAGVNDVNRGWGRQGESERVASELREWGATWPWFTLGDLDLGAHLARTGWLRDGLTVTEVVARLASRWALGASLLPMTDAEVDTVVEVDTGTGRREMHFQEWWTRYRATLRPLAFRNPGMESAGLPSGVAEAIAAADVVVVAPSNPVVSIGPILAVPGMREAIASSHAAVVGVSPIIGGKVVRGMGDVCLDAIGVATSAAAVAEHYRSRRHGGVLDCWILAEEDAHLASAVESAGIAAVVHPLWMTDVTATAAIAEVALRSAGR